MFRTHSKEGHCARTIVLWRCWKCEKDWDNWDERDNKGLKTGTRLGRTGAETGTSGRLGRAGDWDERETGTEAPSAVLWFAVLWRSGPRHVTLVAFSS